MNINYKTKCYAEIMSLGVDRMSFTDRELEILINATKENLSLKYIANPKLGFIRMQFLKNRLDDNMDIKYFASEKYSLSNMMIIAKAITEGYSEEEILSLCDPDKSDYEMLTILTKLRKAHGYIKIEPKYSHRVLRIKGSIIKDDRLDENGDFKILNTKDNDDEEEIIDFFKNQIIETVPVVKEIIPPVTNKLKKEIKEKKSIDLDRFNEKQKEEINKGLEAGIDVSFYTDTRYSNVQMRQIRLGLEHKISVLAFANPGYTKSQMKKIRIGIEEKTKEFKAKLKESIQKEQLINPDRDLNEILNEKKLEIMKQIQIKKEDKIVENNSDDIEDEIAKESLLELRKNY